VIFTSLGGGRFAYGVVITATVVSIEMDLGNEGTKGGGISIINLGPVGRGERPEKMLAMAEEL
ncbi:hypothetical protein KI387_006935, partial [Taxus chinensis]